MTFTGFFLPGFVWLDWVSLISTGFTVSTQNNPYSMTFTGFYRVLPGFVWLDWVSLVSTGFFGFILDFLWLYFTDFYRILPVLPSFAGFYWI